MKRFKQVSKLEVPVNCSSCGVSIPATAAGHLAQVCLICYARALNDQFQKLHTIKSSLLQLNRRY